MKAFVAASPGVKVICCEGSIHLGHGLSHSIKKIGCSFVASE